MTVQDYLDQLLQYMGVGDAAASVQEDDSYMFVDVQTPEIDAGKMIGARGETIQGLRQLIFLSFSEQLGDKKVVVNVNDYKEKKEEAALEMGHIAAERAIEENRPQHLPKYLLAHQRRVIHQDLQDFPGVYTASEGEGRDRHLVVYPGDAHGEEAQVEESAPETTPITE